VSVITTERVRRSTTVLPPPRLVSRTHDTIILRAIVPAHYRETYPIRSVLYSFASNKFLKCSLMTRELIHGCEIDRWWYMVR
jgi:hypothetical protein